MKKLYTINSTWFCGQATTCCDSNTVHWQLLPQLLPRLIFPNFSPRFSLSSTLSLISRRHLVLRKETRIKATPTFHFKERAWNCRSGSNSAGGNRKDILRAGMHSQALRRGYVPIASEALNLWQPGHMPVPYMYSVHVTLPCRMGCRCFWDSDTDSYAQDIFMNVSISMWWAAPHLSTYFVNEGSVSWKWLYNNYWHRSVSVYTCTNALAPRPSLLMTISISIIVLLYKQKVRLNICIVLQNDHHYLHCRTSCKVASFE